MYNVIKYARCMSVSVDDVMQMEFNDFMNKLKYLDCYLAEERFILQKQLDNHLYLQFKKSKVKYTDIYKEFRKEINKATKVTNIKLTDEEKMKLHEANLKRLGLR